MAYNTKNIVKDVDGNPISQYYNPSTDSYEPVEGVAGANKVVLYSDDGSISEQLDLRPIHGTLERLTGTVIDEETRKANEISRQDSESNRDSQESTRVTNEDTRIGSESTRELQETHRVENEIIRQTNESIRVSAENNRESFINEFKSDLSDGVYKGDIGLTGIGLNYNWDGTNLGIKTEDEVEFKYANLIGPQGVQGLQGEKGDSGVNVDINGTYYFSVVDGNLILHYPDGEVAPNFEINEFGELIYYV